MTTSNAGRPTADLSPFDLTGRRALITGSTRGIGAALARALLTAGATVVVHGRDARATAEAAGRLGEETGRANHIQHTSFDVNASESARAAVREIEQQLGGIDILVNNAGVSRPGELVTLDLDDWNHVVSTNLTSCFVLAQEVASGMIERGRGKIINICSVHSRIVRGRVGPYAAAKAGLAALTQVMCAAWASHGIQANGLAPGFIATDMTQRLRNDHDFDAWIHSRTPAARGDRRPISAVQRCGLPRRPRTSLTDRSSMSTAA
jgi:gluconate 5-dehydrogenase